MHAAKPRLLWISDCACPTGFATVTHNVLGWLGTRWDRLVLGVNSTGDPYPLPWPVYVARVGGDVWGFGRFEEMLTKYEPDVVVIQSDSWIVTGFLEIAAILRKRGDVRLPPLVGYMPVDGVSMKRSTAAQLSVLDLAVFYTEFGREQALAAGLTCPTRSIGLGVRRDVFCPMDQTEARHQLSLEAPPGAFVWGNVNRNQPRKRLDLTIAWFAEYLKNGGLDSYLYLHCLRQDIGWDLEELAHHYGVANRVLLTTAEKPEDLVDERRMRAVYNSLDVQLTTTMGEGWGLPTLEGMACGVPQIVPDWAALAEWPRGAVRYVAVEPGEANVGFKAFGIGARPIKAEFLAAMHELRTDNAARRALAQAAAARAAEPRFEWKFAAACFDEDLMAVLAQHRAKAA